MRSASRISARVKSNKAGMNAGKSAPSSVSGIGSPKPNPPAGSAPRGRICHRFALFALLPAYEGKGCLILRSCASHTFVAAAKIGASDMEIQGGLAEGLVFGQNNLIGFVAAACAQAVRLPVDASTQYQAPPRLPRGN
jgi:hypothetical protein